MALTKDDKGKLPASACWLSMQSRKRALLLQKPSTQRMQKHLAVHNISWDKIAWDQGELSKSHWTWLFWSRVWVFWAMVQVRPMGRSRMMPKTAKVTAAPNEGDVVRNPELKRDGAGSGPYCIDEEWRVFICFHNLTMGQKWLPPPQKMEA